MQKILWLSILFGINCQTAKKSLTTDSNQFIVVLGIAQDAGYPHPHCDKACCAAVVEGKEKRRNVTCLGVVDAETQQAFMLEATPDFTEQERHLRNYLTDKSKPLAGIFLTHAHIGHYTGLMYLGREAINAAAMPVYAMPKMKTFLENNGPWSQLVQLKNIKILPLANDSTIQITKNISIKPIIVPHRDEFSETVGYIISSKTKRALFIPDIDKWSKWKRNILDEVHNVDVAFLDATFYKNGELAYRNMSEVPHPFIEETMKLFENSADKAKIKFIHFNHTNPVFRKTAAQTEVLKQGFGVCAESDVIDLNSTALHLSD